MRSEHLYPMTDADLESERARLQTLEALNDEATLRHVDNIRILNGWSCLEIGAGAGSIARALSERTGNQGCVVAADFKPRFLADFDGQGQQVLTHDITEGPVPPGQFDFAHCRALLAHVSNLSVAIHNIVASVRPGGWILCEEADYGSMQACDPNHLHAYDLARFRKILEHGALMNSSAGRDTFEALRTMQLSGVQNQIQSAIAVGGSVRAQYRIHSLQHIRPHILERIPDIEPVHIDRMIEMFDDPTFSYIDNTWVSTWGQVPTR